MTFLHLNLQQSLFTLVFMFLLQQLVNRSALAMQAVSFYRKRRKCACMV